MEKSQHQLNIVAVVVTYNRFALLKEAITAIQGQNFPIKSIIVVNNNSTDETTQWLDQQKDLMVIHQENIGGSGGFFTGIKHAERLNANWIWVMDDDTICEPDSLSKLVEKLMLPHQPIGFIGSKSVWTDGTPHLMNVPAIGPTFNKSIPFNLLDEHSLLLTETSSFVSLLISAEAVRKIGLPYRDFFIWGDDQEYTKRITKAGYLGLYCMDSTVLHKTGVNYFTDFCRDTVGNLWKHHYGFRNEFFLIKRDKGLLYFTFWLPIKLAKISYKVLKARKHDQLKFIGVAFSSAWKSIFFNPKIEKV